MMRAAEIILDTMRQFIISNDDSSIDAVRLTLFDQASVDVFSQAWEAKFDSS
jgi:hypothetical protein